jgi:hypothetical protein
MKPALLNGAIFGNANLMPSEMAKANLFLILKLLTFTGGRDGKAGLALLQRERMVKHLTGGS